MWKLFWPGKLIRDVRSPFPERGKAADEASNVQTPSVFRALRERDTRPASAAGELKKLLFRLLLFSTLVASILLLIDWRLDRNITYFWEYDYEEIIDPKVRANIVILGNSHAKHGVNPRFLEAPGRRVYNFALNGATPMFYGHWYSKLFRERYPKPDLIIYGVNWFMWVEDWIGRRYFEQDSEYFPSWVFWELFFDTSLDRQLLFKNGFLFVKEREHLGDLLRSRSRQPVEGFDLTQYYRGYIPWDIPYDRKPVDLRHESSSRLQRAFEKLLDQYQSDGIRIIFFQSPEYRPGVRSNLILTGTRQLQRLAKNRDIPLLDYNLTEDQRMNREAAFFSDWGHLNEQGSALFSRMLAQDLNRIW